MPLPQQVDLKPIDVENGVRVACDVGFLCASFSLPRPLLLISKMATLRVYIRQNVNMSSFNVKTGVVFHLRNKNTLEIKIHLRQTPFVYNTDVAVFYYCLLSMNSIIILSSCCHLANTNKNEYNRCYLYLLGGKQLCKNFKPNSLVTFDLLTLKVVSESCVTWAISMPILVFLGLSVLDLSPVYVTDRRQTKASLNAPAY